ncbi:hepatocyte growth factor-like [Ruditapes philippinarum]|uniref:hepatocyte growth factor-like n=1 Tax=Ruditapes philippinarum TaxID=129788 RepID=UPI00295C0E2F|nr:hepatocyte growth factor-like [Ruditapes philippinarum]
MTLRMEQIYTVIAACAITSINGEECIDAPSYSGTLNVTLGGYKCQRWDSQQPHQHTRDVFNHFPNDASVKDAHNYCRDADGSCKARISFLQHCLGEICFIASVYEFQLKATHLAGTDNRIADCLSK